MPTRRCWALVAACLAVAAVARVAVAAPEACRPPSAGEARAAAATAAGWLVANQQQDGSYRYAVDPDGRDLGGDSIVRHAGVTMSLYQAAGAPDADARLLAAADRALAWMLGRLARGDGWRALADGSYAPLGGSALMLAALAERRLLTGERTHDDVMRDLGAFLVAMQRDDGDFFVSWDVRAAEPDREGISQYFAGEALWALARLHEALPDARFERAARDAARFVSTGRDDRDFVPVPPLNDHWAAYGFAEMADWPIDDDSARYARALHGRFQLLVRWEAGKDAGAPYSWTHGRPRQAAALGTWVEGQAALARLARTDARLADLRGPTLASTACGSGVLVQRQDRRDDPRVRGAWFTDGVSRMDDQQHAISGLLAYADLLGKEGER